MNKNVSLSQIFNEVMASSLGSEINSDACQVIDENTIRLHFWDGRRYELKLSKQPNGCSYDAATARPVPGTVSPAGCFISPSGAKYALRDPSKPISLNNLIDPECRALGCGECTPDINDLRLLCKDFEMKFPESTEDFIALEDPNAKVTLVR